MRLQRKVLASVVFLLLSTPVTMAATTYYVDYTNGADSNNGTSKTACGANCGPWKNAPGMFGVFGLANSTAIAAGDSIVLKGCVTWPNSTMSWYPKFGGSAGNPVNVGGLDQTWWDSTVSGCATSWNRPILNAQAAAITGQSAFNAFFDCRDSHCHDIFFSQVELTGLYSIKGPINNESIYFNVGSQAVNLVIDNVYVHGWVNPYFCLGTGNIAANSTTITNFVPLSYTPCTGLTSWGGLVQASVLNPNLWWGVQNNGPSVSTITGPNPYQISTNAAHTNSGTCTACLVQVGSDYTFVFAGNEGAISGYVVQNSVVDGSDTVEAQLNPYEDCGASESNNQWCGASGVVVLHVPNILRDNVFRFNQGSFGACSEWSGNLVEDVRLSTDPTAHTNGIECLDSVPVNGAVLKYGNVFRHTNIANASTQFGIKASIGLPILDTPLAPTVEYDFNNVAYDTLQNSWLEFRDLATTNTGYSRSVSSATETGTTATITTSGGTLVTTDDSGAFVEIRLSGFTPSGYNGTWLASSSGNPFTLVGLPSGLGTASVVGTAAVQGGTVDVFNNSSDCGPSWDHDYACVSLCPSGFLACTMENNHWIGSTTVGANQFGPSGGSCGSNCTMSPSNELFQSTTTASGQGYSESQTPFVFAPSTGGSTINQGVNLQSLCGTIASANSAAGTACQSDTSYAVTYNSTSHTVTVPARTTNLRPVTGTGCPGNSTCWDIGAYQSVAPVGFTPETVATTGLAGANSGAVASVTNTTAETSLCSLTLPAKELGNNQELRLHCEGVVTWAAGPNLAITLRAGGTTGMSLGSLTLTFVGTQSSDFGFTCDFSIAANTAPAASVATEVQGGCFVYSNNGTHFITSGALANGSTKSWDTDDPSVITIDASWATASTSNTITSRLFDVVRLN